MARPRNVYGLFGHRSFSIPTHEQRFQFFSIEDKMNGVMDIWVKSVENENWERHDFGNCTVFNCVSNSNDNSSKRSIPFMMRFNNISISTILDFTRIGILARINEYVVNNLTSMFPHIITTAYQTDFTTNSIKCAKRQAIQHMVEITAAQVSFTSISVARPTKDEMLFHEIQQLESKGLCININKPINIDTSLVGMWISISWERKSINCDIPSYFTFDVGLIVKCTNNAVQVLYEEDGRKIYSVELHCDHWFKSLESPPTSPNQWRLLSKKVRNLSQWFMYWFSITY